MKNRILFIAVLACWLTGSSLALAVPKLVLVNEFHTVRTFDNSHNTPASTKPTHPSSRWVEQRYGSVPENAVVFTNKNNFSTSTYPILSLTGEKDGLSTPGKIKETKHLLSKNTELVQVKGANHAQFGMYGKQKGDNKASISTKEQQDELVKRTVKWLNSQMKKSVSN